MFKALLTRLDNLFKLNIERLPPEGDVVLPTTLWAFVWYFVRQIKPAIFTIMFFELVLALMISISFWYVGILVREEHYTSALLLGGVAILGVRLMGEFFLMNLYELMYIPHFGNLIRRQLFWYVSHHSLAFFQNDFAGRIGNKILRSAPSLRDAVKSTIGAVWFAAIFTISNLWVMSHINWMLALPLYVWLVLYGITLWYFVPKVKERSAKHSEDMSQLTGQTVDMFTNFILCKYFARTKHEDKRTIELLHAHSKSFRFATGTIARMAMLIESFNFLLLVSTGYVGYYLLQRGEIDIAAIATALPMALQATFQSGWIMFEVSNIFENLGAVQEGVDTLSKPHTVKDVRGAKALDVGPKTASIGFNNVVFNYGETDPDKRVFDAFNLHIPAGQKVGLVGRSGAGKSTLANILVRAYDIDGGDITINNQDIAKVKQDSLRRAITIVTQESYLFHRSVLDNIRYGNPKADMDLVIKAAKAANAHEFIQSLSDSKGRKGYDAHIGERGVKLSGGQRQRLAIARALLKDAPILILDEATSALDSESEHAIQEALENVMEGKTVIAIAHRLSTLRQMDRILVLDKGKIIEDGTHTSLVRKKGVYADLWHRQTGGYLPEDEPK